MKRMGRMASWLLVFLVWSFLSACPETNASRQDSGTQNLDAAADAGLTEDAGVQLDAAQHDSTQQGTDAGSADMMSFSDATAGDVLVLADAATAVDGATSPGENFSFLVYGDSRSGGDCTGNANHISLVQRMSQEADVSFVVNVGDMISGYSDSTCFADNGSCTGDSDYGDLSQIIQPLSSITAMAGLSAYYFPVIGNHEEGSEWYPDPCGGEICDTFDMNALVNHPTPNSDPCGQDYPSQAYYSFKYRHVAFFVLRANSDYFDFFTCNYPADGWDSCADYCKNAPRTASLYDSCWNVHQYDWLKNALEQADADTDIHKKIIFLHAPVYTSFEDHPAFASAGVLSELADAHQVAMIFNGHNHCYERTVPILAGAQDDNGITYVTTSGGGVGMYEPAGDWFTAAHSGEHHYMRIDVSSDSISGQAIGDDGSILDSFILN